MLADAARSIKAGRPWYETLGLRYEELADRGGDVTVEAVLAFNVVSGVLDAAHETVLGPVFIVLKGLLGAVQGAAAAREEVIELLEYCVGISRCFLEAARVEDMSRTMILTLGEYKGEMEAVGRFVSTYGTQTGFFRRMILNSRDQETAAGHRRKLKDLLDAVLADLAVQAHVGVRRIEARIADRDPPLPGGLAEVPREAPVLPRTYVQRAPLMEKAIHDLANPQRSPSAIHCLLGMGGAGKSLLASAIVRDDRIRSIFKGGIFWLTVGRAHPAVALLLEHLARVQAAAPTDTPFHCPHRFGGAEEIVRHLSAVLSRRGCRSLLVLDDVWNAEVVNVFKRTGFHVLVTTRRRATTGPSHSVLCTEVGDMAQEDALAVLRKACQAHGELPPEALQVCWSYGISWIALYCMVVGEKSDGTACSCLG